LLENSLVLTSPDILNISPVQGMLSAMNEYALLLIKELFCLLLLRSADEDIILENP
jgi:hypothetical protein